MTRLAPLLNVWKKRWARLLLGLTLAELSICVAFLLMGQTGSRLGAATASGAVGLLCFAGLARLVFYCAILSVLPHMMQHFVFWQISAYGFTDVSLKERRLVLASAAQVICSPA